MLAQFQCPLECVPLKNAEKGLTWHTQPFGELQCTSVFVIAQSARMADADTPAPTTTPASAGLSCHGLDEGCAIFIREPGGYDKLEVAEPLSAPTRGPNIAFLGVDEADLVTVRTHATGVNYADVCVRWGLYSSAKQYVGWPICPGFEFAGEVQSVGSAVTAFAPGDMVFGVTMFGGYSTHITVPHYQLFRLPPFLSPATAAGFPAVHLTAWYAAFKLADHLCDGDHVLVHSAAGGVGSALVQMLKIRGCRVVGVVGSSHKVQYCRDLGCDVVINKSTEQLWPLAVQAAPRGFRAIFDANGAETLAMGYNVLAPSGRLITYGFHSMLPKVGGRLGLRQWLHVIWDWLWTPRFNPLEMVSANKSVMAFNLSFLFDQVDLFTEGLQQNLTWMEKGLIKAPRVTSYPLRQVARAHAALESGQTVGKLVLATL